MASVTICSDFGVQENKSLSLFPLFPHLFAMKWWDWMSITSASLTTLKPLIVRITTNWKILEEMGIPDHLTCLLRNLYAGQEATFRTKHGTTDLFNIGKGVHQSCILSHCLCNLHAEYIMRNAGLDEAQAGIKIVGRNINNLRNTTVLGESKEPRSVLVKVKEEREKASLKLNIQKSKIMASGPITSWPINGKTMETVKDFIFLSSKITADCDCSYEIKKTKNKKYLLFGRKSLTNLDGILTSRDITSPTKVL